MDLECKGILTCMYTRFQTLDSDTDNIISGCWRSTDTLGSERAVDDSDMFKMHWLVNVSYVA